MSAITRQNYASAIKRLSVPYGVLFFAVVIPGVLGALYGADRIATGSSWPREWVFIAMLPVFLAPIILGACLMSIVDRRIGLKCHSCGGSLSMGSHVRRLLRSGGACPRCGAIVVDQGGNAELDAPPDGRPTKRPANPGDGGEPPSSS